MGIVVCGPMCIYRSGRKCSHEDAQDTFLSKWFPKWFSPRCTEWGKLQEDCDMHELPPRPPMRGRAMRTERPANLDGISMQLHTTMDPDVFFGKRTMGGKQLQPDSTKVIRKGLIPEDKNGK